MKIFRKCKLGFSGDVHVNKMIDFTFTKDIKINILYML